jgi:hypothetical protein
VLGCLFGMLGSIAAHLFDQKSMSVPLIVIAFFAFPLLWIATFTDKQSFDLAVKLGEIIAEIIQSLEEWESSKLSVIKMQAFKAYAPNLENKLGLIQGYLIIRFVARLPRKRNIRAACAILPEFYKCIWYDPPELRHRAEILAIELKRLLK